MLQLITLNTSNMKKLGFLFVVMAFFGFVTLSSCNQAAKEGESTEQAAPEAEMEEATEEAVEEATEEATEEAEAAAEEAVEEATEEAAN